MIKIEINKTRMPWLLAVFLMLFVSGNCRMFGFDTEKEVCEARAQDDYIRCLLGYSLTSDVYYGTNNTDAIDSFAFQYCSIEYSRKTRCPERKDYLPAKRD